jgi:uncharacterized protein YqgV (UPF0045/DUF77 family)
MEISKEVSIKDLLKKGTTEKELQDILSEQIKEAQKEINAEKVNHKVNKRAAAVEAFAEYINTIGYGEIMFADDVEKAINWIEKNEDLVKNLVDVYLRKNRKYSSIKIEDGPTLKSSVDDKFDYIEKILDKYKKMFE